MDESKLQKFFITFKRDLKTIVERSNRTKAIKEEFKKLEETIETFIEGSGKTKVLYDPLPYQIKLFYSSLVAYYKYNSSHILYMVKQ